MVGSVFNTIDHGLHQLFSRTDMQTLSYAYTLLQTITIYKESTDPRVAQHIHKIQTVFNLADIGWVCFGLKRVVDGIQKKYGTSIFSFPEKKWTERDYFKALGGALATGGGFYLTTFIVALLLNKHFKSYDTPENLLVEKGFSLEQQKNEKVSINFDPPKPQFFSQQLLAARIILNSALMYLSPSRTLPILNLLIQNYALIKLSQLKWLNFTRVFDLAPEDDQSRISQATITYHALLTPFVPPKTEGDSQAPEGKNICHAMCEEEKPDTYFCANHTFHTSCLAGSIYAKSRFFADQTIYTPIQKKRGYSYEVKLKQDNLPSCPQPCNQKYPGVGYFDITVQDLDHGKITADVLLTK